MEPRGEVADCSFTLSGSFGKAEWCCSHALSRAGGSLFWETVRDSVPKELDSNLLTFLPGSRRPREPSRLATAVRFLQDCYRGKEAAVRGDAEDFFPEGLGGLERDSTTDRINHGFIFLPTWRTNIYNIYTYVTATLWESWSV